MIWTGCSATTLATVRQVQSDEARGVRPLPDRTGHRARGRHAQGLAARMAVDRPLERFLLINGLDRSQALKVGERYKIAVE